VTRRVTRRVTGADEVPGHRTGVGDTALQAPASTPAGHLQCPLCHGVPVNLELPRRLTRFRLPLAHDRDDGVEREILRAEGRDPGIVPAEQSINRLCGIEEDRRLLSQLVPQSHAIIEGCIAGYPEPRQIRRGDVPRLLRVAAGDLGQDRFPGVLRRCHRIRVLAQALQAIRAPVRREPLAPQHERQARDRLPEVRPVEPVDHLDDRDGVQPVLARWCGGSARSRSARSCHAGGIIQPKDQRANKTPHTCGGWHRQGTGHDHGGYEAAGWLVRPDPGYWSDRLTNSPGMRIELPFPEKSAGIEPAFPEKSVRFPRKPGSGCISRAQPWEALETGIHLPAPENVRLRDPALWARSLLSPGTMTIKIKVGSLVLTAPRDENLPQEFAAWHQTVRILPGTYDVFAYLDADRTVRQLSAECEGITISSNFRSHLLGVWGKHDNNRNGERATAHIHLPTSGLVDVPMPALLAQATLCEALVRTEWNPRDFNPPSTFGRMWRLTWNPAHTPIIIQEARHAGGLRLAAFEDSRRFRVDAAEMTAAAVRELDVSLSGILHSIDQLDVNETKTGWSWNLKKSCEITRLA